MKLTSASLLLIASLVISGCSSTSHCRSIGCGQDVTTYPNEEFAMSREAARHGFEWGKTSSAYSPRDPKHHELKAKEIEQGETPWHWNQ
jgi:hypothetical protein